MSKAVFNKWMDTYRTVTEVDFHGVDQWEGGDIEIAFIEGYISGQRDGIVWVIKTIGNQLRCGKTIISDKAVSLQKKLDKALAIRGNRKDIGGVQEHKSVPVIKVKTIEPTMTEQVALCKFEVMTKSKQLEVMESAISYMEQSNSQSRERCIARGVADILGIKLR